MKMTLSGSKSSLEIKMLQFENKMHKWNRQMNVVIILPAVYAEWE